jgi:hypothetical protein
LPKKEASQIEKILAKKIYRFCQKIKFWPRKNIIFAKKKKFSQKEVYVFPRDRILTKNRYRFSQEEI